MPFNAKSVLGALALSAVLGSGAFAATVNTTIDFEGPEYDMAANSSAEVDGYLISPTNLSSGNCADGLCTIESKQAALPDVTRTEDPLEFSLLSFWFTLEGNGSAEYDDAGNLTNNYLEVIAYTGIGAQQTAVASLKIAINTLLSSYSSLATVVFYPDGEGTTGNTNGPCDENTKVCKQRGYLVTLTSSLFQDVTKISFTSMGDAQARLDDIVLSRETPPAPVPLPAAGFLLAGALGGLTFLRRRKSA